MGRRRSERSASFRAGETTAEHAGVRSPTPAPERPKDSISRKLHSAGNRVLGRLLLDAPQTQRDTRRDQAKPRVEFMARGDARRVLAEYVAQAGVDDTMAAMNAIVAELDRPVTPATAVRQLTLLTAAFSLLDAEGASLVFRALTQPGAEQRDLSGRFSRLDAPTRDALLGMLGARKRDADEAEGTRQNARLKTLIAVEGRGRSIGLIPRATAALAAQPEVAVRTVKEGPRELAEAAAAVVTAPVHLARSVLAFLDGIFDGLRESISLDTVRTLMAQMPDLSDVPIFGPAFIKGLAVGIYREGRAIVDQAIEIVSHPIKFLGDVFALAETMLGRGGAELGRVMGTETGKHYGQKIAGLAGKDTWDFGRGLGEITGPAVVSIVLSLLGAGLVKLSGEVVAKLSKIKAIERLLAKYAPPGIRARGGATGKRARRGAGRTFDEDAGGSAKTADVQESPSATSTVAPAAVEGLGPAYSTFDQIEALVKAGKLRDKAHVLGVVVKDPQGRIVGRWYEVSELDVGTAEARLLGHTEQKALARLEAASLEPGSTLELVGTLQPCNLREGCSNVMNAFVQKHGVDIRYRHVYGETGTTIHDFRAVEGRITKAMKEEEFLH